MGWLQFNQTYSQFPRHRTCSLLFSFRESRHRTCSLLFSFRESRHRTCSLLFSFRESRHRTCSVQFPRHRTCGLLFSFRESNLRSIPFLNTEYLALCYKYGPLNPSDSLAMEDLTRDSNLEKASDWFDALDFLTRSRNALDASTASSFGPIKRAFRYYKFTSLARATKSPEALEEDSKYSWSPERSSPGEAVYLSFGSRPGEVYLEAILVSFGKFTQRSSWVIKVSFHYER